MQTVRDFFLDPQSGYVPVNNSFGPVPDWMISGVAAPVAELQHTLTIAEVTDVPTPTRLLWRRPANILTR